MFIIKPAPGCAARHPGTLRLLAEQGEAVAPSPYWHRLIAAGAVITCDPPAEPAPDHGDDDHSDPHEDNPHSHEQELS